MRKKDTHAHIYILMMFTSPPPSENEVKNIFHKQKREDRNKKKRFFQQNVVNSSFHNLHFKHISTISSLNERSCSHFISHRHRLTQLRNVFNVVAICH